MKKISVITLTAILLFTTSAVYAVKQQTYKDLKATNWAYESIQAMSDKDVMKGYPDSSFKPQSTVTYGEFIKMMVVAVTGEVLKVAEKPHHWAHNYYKEGLELSLFEESEIDITMLDQPIPRSDMALIISNGLEKTGIENYSKIEAMVKDVESTTKYSYQIIKSYAAGILSGYSDGTFKPQGTLTRAESSLVLYRYIDERKRTPIKINEKKTLNDVENNTENIDAKESVI
ncbi:S-layer homology domain-containing protein [Sinanaerobacter sp. ZZT-01]|uniref:S-layer homology domain-containing protein n=1 Tax=Sinanaerobacter sp. ZZT-01 TaxID=3111540 RepID=UPI002D78DD80|nr:S-layer homology domain-containing protein [Sinanaerobacter sp. ZZT-01]WRR93290.1 S-layer homology domain-containing protein [Sinanaerobacter sp. ZZT-01]